MCDRFTHFDENGSAVMVDVCGKAVSEREAYAAGVIRMRPETLAMILGGTAKKGDVLGVARIAGIMAAKRTSELIPLCHPVMTEHLSIEFFPDEKNSLVEARMSARLTGKTGLEMEALTGVSVALLTIYDMCKAVDRAMEIDNIRLLRKSGGKSGLFIREASDA